MNDKLKIAIGIATAGRPDEIQLTLKQLERQQLAPDATFVCPACASDFDHSKAHDLRVPVQVIYSQRGLCAQRNSILRLCQGVDIIVFIDDDYYPAPDYLTQVNELFTRYPDIVIATNQPVLDGATGPGISHEHAVNLIDGLARIPTGSDSVTDTYGGYGCNMAIRLAPALQNDVRFDERLPLYGWLEDIDFSRRLAPYGRIVNFSALRGVHLATKKGRSSGVRLGYSQVANPIYMVRKGSLTANFAYSQILRNIAKNIVRSPRPEPWVDRRGRLKGNILAFRDLLLSRIDPSNIIAL